MSLLGHSPSPLKDPGEQERCLRTGEKPMSLQSSKKGKKEDPGTYRSVSLTSIPGKMMEQFILEGIIKQVEEKKVIRSSQHGFTKGVGIVWAADGLHNLDGLELCP